MPYRDKQARQDFRKTDPGCPVLRVRRHSTTFSANGDVAQLGERFVRNEQVEGSNPFVSIFDVKCRPFETAMIPNKIRNISFETLSRTLPLQPPNGISVQLTIDIALCLPL